MDGLGRLGGAHDIQVDLNTGWVTLRCGPDEAIDLASVPRAIRDAGFEPTDLHIVAHGALVRTPDDELALQIDGWPIVLPVVDAGSASDPGRPLRAQVTGWESGVALSLVVLSE